MKQRIKPNQPRASGDPPWDKLFSRLSDVYTVAGLDRQKAVLNNHASQKEKICRKLGVISEADIIRISHKLGIDSPGRRK